MRHWASDAESGPEEFNVSDRGTTKEMDTWWVGTTYFREIADHEEDEVDEWHRWSPQMVKGLLRGVGTPGQPTLTTNLSAVGLERGQLIKAQIECPEYGAYYAAAEAAHREEDIKKAVQAYQRDHPDYFRKRKVDAVVNASTAYELVDGLLMRRVYDLWDHEVQLRIVAPTTSMGLMEVVGVGHKPLGIRERILTEYHNGKLGGHLGVNKTVNRIMKDWYWPGLYDDVSKWCRKMCDLCRGEKGSPGISAWSRTELYSRPFRVIQFDTVTCLPASGNTPEHGMNYVLTAICCFSRFTWLVPIPDRTAPTIAKALLEKVLIDLAMFPTVLRSDRASEFVGEIVDYINRMLEIRHVLGSSYHPQSQGIVERMHRTMTLVVKSLVADCPETWPSMVPYAQCVLRIVPLQVLGNRSPYVVVTGLRLKLPSAMLAKYPVQDITVETYAERLIEHLRETYQRIHALMQDASDRAEEEAEGTLAGELRPGDLVLRKRNPSQIDTAAGQGPRRYVRVVDPRVYKIVKGAGGQSFSFYLQDLHEPTRKLTFHQPVSRKFLIRLDMPELAEGVVQEKRRLEIQSGETMEWRKGTLETVTIDGEAKVRWDDTPATPEVLDLSETRYRFIAGERPTDWEDQ